MNTDRITWGIILFLVAVAILLAAVIPGLGLFGLPLWKWLLTAIFLYWTLKPILFGKTLAAHFRFFFPLSFLFMLHEDQIAARIGRGGEDLINNWLLLAVALMLTVACEMIFHHGKGYRKVVTLNESGESVAHTAANGESRHTNHMASAAYYLDARQPSHTVTNELGASDVFFEHLDEPGADPINLCLHNELGRTVVHVPAEWTVAANLSNEFGAVNVRSNVTAEGRRLVVTGSNELGSTEIVSP